MNISRSDLYRIIVEEYVKETYLDEALSDEKTAELIAWIKGKGARPEWATDDLGTSGRGQAVQTPDDSDVDRVADLIQGMPPEEVSDLFQAVFAKIPGVEIGPPEEEESDTLYSPGAEGRPQVGFRLEELRNLIREVLEEAHYHDMGGEDEMYNALDPYNFEKMSDAELIDMMYKDGMEELISLDGEGGLANRDVVIKALKDV